MPATATAAWWRSTKRCVDLPISPGAHRVDRSLVCVCHAAGGADARLPGYALALAAAGEGGQGEEVARVDADVNTRRATCQWLQSSSSANLLAVCGRALWVQRNAAGVGGVSHDGPRFQRRSRLARWPLSFATAPTYHCFKPK